MIHACPLYAIGANNVWHMNLHTPLSKKTESFSTPYTLDILSILIIQTITNMCNKILSNTMPQYSSIPSVNTILHTP